MYFYSFNMSYFIFVMPALIFALWAQFNVNSTFKKYTNKPSEHGMTGYDAARMILDRHGLTNVSISEVGGNLSDHYDPRSNVIRLSSSVYGGRNASAIGVAAHEAGHAVQHAEGYAPIKLREAIIPVTRIGSSLAFPLVLIGILFSYLPIAYIGIILFGAVVLFQLVTLPVEFNASNRALASLEESGRFSNDSIQASAKVLKAAALTYVAALAVSLGNMMRLISIVNNRRK